VTDLGLYARMFEVALEEARAGAAEGGIPIGAALFRRTGELISRGHNRRVQQSDPSVHAETDAFRRAGMQSSYRDLVMVTTLAPCWYCSGLVRQFRIGALVVGESRTFAGGVDWLRANGVEVSTSTMPSAGNYSSDTSRQTRRSGMKTSGKIATKFQRSVL